MSDAATMVDAPHPPAGTGSAIDWPLVATLLRDDRIDAAIDAGLMDAPPPADLPADDRARITATRERLRTAWQARERYRQREARLARRAAERDARRVVAPVNAKPALPAAAAAALARARSKAGAGKGPSA